MTSLSQLVLPLEQSRALVEKGIVLDTVFSWFRCKRAKDRAANDGYSVAHYEEEYRVPVTRVCSAPILSELLDAIRTKCPDVNFEIYNTPHGVRKIQAWINDDSEEIEAEASGDLLAAAKLLMEVKP